MEGIQRIRMKRGIKMRMTTIFTTSRTLHLKGKGTSLKKDSQDRTISLRTKTTGRSSSKPSRSVIRGSQKRKTDISPCPASLNSPKNCCSASKRATTMGSIDLISTKGKKLSRSPLRTLLRRATKAASSNLDQLNAKTP